MPSVKKIRLSIAVAAVAAACVIGGFNTALAAADDIKGPSTGGAPAPEQREDPIGLDLEFAVSDNDPTCPPNCPEIAKQPNSARTAPGSLLRGRAYQVKPSVGRLSPLNR